MPPKNVKKKKKKEKKKGVIKNLFELNWFRISFHLPFQLTLDAWGFILNKSFYLNIFKYKCLKNIGF